MRSPLDRLRIGLAVLLAIVALSVVGYRLAGWGWLDAFYMVVITLATVGYGEESKLSPAEQWLTIGVVVFGISAAVYTIGGFLQLIAQGEIERVFGRRRMAKDIERLERHVIICGFGRIGHNLADELHRQKLPFVVIDRAQPVVDDAVRLGFLAMVGDSTEEETLQQVGIGRARALVTALPEDADNVFIALTARNLNRHLQIIARGESPSSQKKLLQAGADRVVLPASIGALRIAAMLTKPSTLELMELVVGRSIVDVEIDELTLPAESPLVGKTVLEAETRRRHGLLIVAIKSAVGQMVFNPDADVTFGAGDVVIVMGRIEHVKQFRAEYRI